MAYRPLTDIPISLLTASSTMASGYVLKAYLTNTTTPATLYSDASGTSAGTSITLDARGEPTTIKRVWLDTAVNYKLVLETDGGAVVWTADPVYGVVAGTFLQSGTGAVEREANAKMGERISVRDYGAACDGVTDDSLAVQKAIDYCAANGWPALVIPGKCRINSSVTIDRLVDTTTDEFRIIGEGPSAGFYTAGNVTIFDSTLAYTADPQSEFVTFENLRFESSAHTNTSYVMSENFLRIKFINCYFKKIGCVSASIYVQTWHFFNCNIRDNKDKFIESNGLFDVLFHGTIGEDSARTLVRCIGSSTGCNALRFVDCLLEGFSETIVEATGLSAFVLKNSYLEANTLPAFNFGAGSINNRSIDVAGNFFASMAGDIIDYGSTTTAQVVSVGNTILTGTLHGNANSITNLVSIGDNGTTSDATIYTTVNGVYRAGSAHIEWRDYNDQFTKDTAGNFGIGTLYETATRMMIKGSGTSSAAYGLKVLDGNGNEAFLVRNDRKVLVRQLGNYADDTAAAAGGIPVDGLYRNGSVLMIRVS